MIIIVEEIYDVAMCVGGETESVRENWRGRKDCECGG